MEVLSQSRKKSSSLSLYFSYNSTIFNICMYMDGVVREVNAKVQGRGEEMLGRGKRLESRTVIVCG